jgi:hypothetical protein
MMRIVKKYDMSDEADMLEYELEARAPDMYAALHTIYSTVRRATKYTDYKTEAEAEVAEKIKTEVYEAIGILLDD